MLKWCVKKCSVPADELVRFYGVRKPLAYALYNRKIRDRNEIKRYMDIKSFDFEDITHLSGVNEAFSVIKEAVDKNSKIYIYGDYDADGVMSTAIMFKGLSELGADVHYFIPHRVEDGYGLNDRAVDMLIKNGAELIITCDNGITAANQITLAKSRGVKTVILDHHEPPFEERNGIKYNILPDADAVVDAKIQDCGYRYTQMCAGGLCYRFICGFYDFLGKRLVNKNELCELAAVATICDVVDLTDENRAIAAKGLELMNNGSSNRGLRKLIELKGLKRVTSYSVGFVIGPCINASGRLDSAKIAVELFITESEQKAKELAEKLNDYNEDRKNITAESFERIAGSIEKSSIVNDKIIVAYDREAHESVAGIIAGRIREKYGRPAIVLTKAEAGVKGSGRSVENYDMFNELYGVKELMIKFGGHKMAAGLSMEEKNIDIFRKKLNDNCKMSIEELKPVLRLEAVIQLEDITVKSTEELNILAPFGKANEKPLYGIKNVKATNIKFVGVKKNIVSFIVDDGIRRIKAVDFNNFDLWEKNIKGLKKDNYSANELNIDAAFVLEVNEYNGYKSPQIVVRDVKIKV